MKRAGFLQAPIATICFLVLIGALNACATDANAPTASDPAPESASGVTGANAASEPGASKEVVTLAQAQQNKIVHQYTLEKLESAAVYLRARVDSNKLSKTETAKKFCSISEEEARHMMTALQPIIEQKAKGVAEIRILHKSKAKDPETSNISESRWRSCSKTCVCRAYQEVLSAVEDGKRTETDRLTLEWLNSAGVALETADAIKCAKKTNWFCWSPLYRHLKAEAKQFKSQ